jgi:dihydroorotate dehydrogenase electron transfer subunit
MSNAKQIKSRIISIEPTGSYLHLVLEAPEVANYVEPGHFVAIAVGGVGSGMLLRRAFSIHRATADKSIEVIFAAHGQGTQWLAEQKAGTQLDIIAPLGKPFALPRQPVGCVLVAGGYGAAPMMMLAEQLKQLGCSVEVVLGAASEDKLFGVLESKAIADVVTVTTDDGSSGVRGRVTDVLPDAIKRVSAKAVYACGPMPMLKAVAQVSKELAAYSQCAVEEAMACGIGVCMTCVLPVIGDDGVTRMVRSCVEGPVFRGDRVRWDDVDTIPADTFGAPTGGGH